MLLCKYLELLYLFIVLHINAKSNTETFIGENLRFIVLNVHVLLMKYSEDTHNELRKEDIAWVSES
jgi:hypothetical protein